MPQLNNLNEFISGWNTKWQHANQPKMQQYSRLAIKELSQDQRKKFIQILNNQSSSIHEDGDILGVLNTALDSQIKKQFKPVHKPGFFKSISRFFKNWGNRVSSNQVILVIETRIPQKAPSLDNSDVPHKDSSKKSEDEASPVSQTSGSNERENSFQSKSRPSSTTSPSSSISQSNESEDSTDGSQSTSRSSSTTASSSLSQSSESPQPAQLSLDEQIFSTDNLEKFLAFIKKKNIFTPERTFTIWYSSFLGAIHMQRDNTNNFQIVGFKLEGNQVKSITYGGMLYQTNQIPCELAPYIEACSKEISRICNLK